MPHILLTGAGFSHNWGGWLASEAFEYLIGSPEADERLRYELWQAKSRNGGFEDALTVIQEESERNASPENKRALEIVTASVIGMFNAMNRAFSSQRLEEDGDQNLVIKRFLSRFDAIFTLNQDTLLENHYLGGVRWSERWAGSYLPYMEPTSVSPPAHYYHPLDQQMSPAKDFIERVDLQPYYKLHGSYNWISGADSLMIVGGNKIDRIRSFEVLNRYHREFSERLRKPNTRLMVVGYGFGDNHINEAICKAADGGQLRVFIIDPLGLDVLKKQNPRLSIRVPEPLVERLSSSIIGASRRPLRSTLLRDRVELDKIANFFQ